MPVTPLASRLTALQPVAIAVPRPPTTGPDPDPLMALTTGLDLQMYRAILAPRTWMFIRQAFVATRAYHRGLEAGLRLLRAADAHRAALSPRELESHIATLGLFVLEMLDRDDQWDAYLATWESVREHTDCALTYRLGARQQYGARLTPYILRENAHCVTVHFLWLTRDRKAVIERKAQRQRRGQKLGNLWHAPQDALSEDELRERLRWIVWRAREAAASR